MKITPAPRQYSGPFSQFLNKHVVPNLPSVQRVESFDEMLRSYLATSNPLHIVRFVKSQERGDICSNSFGSRMLPTDNSPVWWLHAHLCTDNPLPSDPEAFFSELPAHMFKLPRSPKYLNALGYHAAHLIGAKDGNIDWKNWTRQELVRRTLLNVHPCNMFLVSKVDWKDHGGRSDILNWVEHEYIDRYGSLMRSFLFDVDIQTDRTERPSDPFYEYGFGANTNLPLFADKLKTRSAKPTHKKTGVKPLKVLHVINKKSVDGPSPKNLWKSEAEENVYFSGYWDVSLKDAESLIGGMLFLHETKRNPSRIGGRILAVKQVHKKEFTRPARIIFKLQSLQEGHGVVWRGAAHSMASYGGIIDVAD